MDSLIYIVVLLIILVAFLFAYLIFEKIRRENTEEKLLRLLSGHDKVEAKRSLLTDSEKRFFQELFQAFAIRYYLFSQVSLSALVQIKDDQLDKYERRKLINEFYVDFVLCERESLKPVLVIELNDKSHKRNNRKERDAYLGAVLKSAGINFYICPSNHLTYSHFIKEIENKLNIRTI